MFYKQKKFLLIKWLLNSLYIEGLSLTQILLASNGF